MSAESVKIMKMIKQYMGASGTKIELATVKRVSPIVLKIDDVGYDVTSGIKLNAILASHTRNATLRTSSENYSGEIAVGTYLSAGDRVAVACISPSCTVVLCKVVNG